MSWLAHVTEQFVFKRHIPRLDLRWLLVGGMAPDGLGMLKVLIYTHVLDYNQHRGVDPANPDVYVPMQFGVMHTIFFGICLTILVYLYYLRKNEWVRNELAIVCSVSVLVGEVSHIISDSFDSLGCMWLWPFISETYPIGLWEYRAQYGLYNDFMYFHWGNKWAPFIECFFATWAAYILYKNPNVEWGNKIVRIKRKWARNFGIGYAAFLWIPYFILNYIINYDFG